MRIYPILVKIAPKPPKNSSDAAAYLYTFLILRKKLNSNFSKTISDGKILISFSYSACKNLSETPSLTKETEKKFKFVVQ
jgi:hypothetical protein